MAGPVPPSLPLSWPGMAEMSQRAPNKWMEGYKGMEEEVEENKRIVLRVEKGVIVSERDSLCGRTGCGGTKGQRKVKPGVFFL